MEGKGVKWGEKEWNGGGMGREKGRQEEKGRKGGCCDDDA